MFNFFEELFAPGRKHVSDEQKRLELSRVDLGIGDPDRGPIDLTSGKVTVRAPGPGGAAAPDGAPVPRDGDMRQVPPERDAVLAPRTRLGAEPTEGRASQGDRDDGPP
ncbi:DUF6191 domain-containing protein [Streptomyces sp. ID05-18]|uniref:DUF6191 domain-containing protein n=1 Tax=Streptomyces sp. ID05-18 TaxID=3028662 RepID=UPI0029A63EDD|nr:DUF6191 domain-containing protein [Streptomyces sp. ID05-18]MDX3485231.1 DUF6191 domain-containing protein [Streptomyces sp. ID05-18]